VFAGIGDICQCILDRVKTDDVFRGADREQIERTMFSGFAGLKDAQPVRVVLVLAQ
jgi:hypothetical protein